MRDESFILRRNGAGDVIQKNRWSQKLTRLIPMEERRSAHRSHQRWYGDINRIAGINYYKVHRAEILEKYEKEAHVQMIETAKR